MKKLFILPFLALMTALGSCAATPEVCSPLEFGVAFYNLENLFDTINTNGKYDQEFSPAGARQWDSEKYWSKINNLARCISNMVSETTPDGPAIIGIAEVENSSVVADLVAAPALKDWGLRYVHHDSPDRRGIDVSLLYNPALFTVIDVTNHTLIVPDNPDLRTRDQMCVTGVLGGDTLSVIVNHWPSRLGGQERSSYLREAAGELCKHIADSLWAIRPNQGVIIMGDLNDDPQDKSCAVALGAQRDEATVGPHGFFNPFWAVLDGGVGTLAYKGAWNLFDQIIVSGTLLAHNRDLSLNYASCKVNDFDFLYATEGPAKGTPLRTHSRGVWLNGYSDHFPTIIYLRKDR